jgi:hypothetical protein
VVRRPTGIKPERHPVAVWQQGHAIMRRDNYTDRSSNDPRGSPRGGVAIEAGGAVVAGLWDGGDGVIVTGPEPTPGTRTGCTRLVKPAEACPAGAAAPDADAPGADAPIRPGPEENAARVVGESMRISLATVGKCLVKPEGLV